VSYFLWTLQMYQRRHNYSPENWNCFLKKSWWLEDYFTYLYFENGPFLGDEPLIFRDFYVVLHGFQLQDFEPRHVMNAAWALARWQRHCRLMGWPQERLFHPVVLHDIGERNVTLLGTITYPLPFGYGYDMLLPWRVRTKQATKFQPAWKFAWHLMM